MRKWAREHGLLLANAGLFLAFFGGMVLSGAAAYSEDQTAHGQPGVTLKVQSQGGELSGTVIFYVFRDEGDGPQVAGKTELPLVDPKFDSRTLRFHVKHHDHGGSVGFEMTLTSENEGVLKRLTENKGPNDLKMVRLSGS